MTHAVTVVLIVQVNFYSAGTWDFWNFLVSFVYLDLLCCSLPTTVSVISDHLLLEVCGIYWKNHRISMVFTSSGYLWILWHMDTATAELWCGIIWHVFGYANILRSWIQFAQKNCSGRKAGMSTTFRRKHITNYSRRARILLSQSMRIIFLILSFVDCKMFLSRAAAISLDCRRSM